MVAKYGAQPAAWHKDTQEKVTPTRIPHRLLLARAFLQPFQHAVRWLVGRVLSLPLSQ